MLLRPSVDTLIFPTRSAVLSINGLKSVPLVSARYSSSQRRTLNPRSLSSCSRSSPLIAQWSSMEWHSSTSIKSRSFSTKFPLHKGQKHKHRAEEAAAAAATAEPESRGGHKTGSHAELTPLSEAVELLALKTEIKRIQEKLKKSLSILKPGGQFSPVFLETLRVDMSKLTPAEPINPANNRSHAKETKTKWIKNDATTHEQQKPSLSKLSRAKAAHRIYMDQRSSAATLPLKEVAQVIPRGGKTAIIMLNEEDFVKPVTSALLGSPYSLNPQPSATNPLELIVPIPPPTAETRQMNAGQADKYLERAENDLREGRADMQKTLRALSVAGQLGPDALRKAQKEMEKLVDETRTDFKKACDASKKALMQTV